MKKMNLDITRLIIFFWSLVSILTKCPNDCSGHGICNLDGRCTCFNTAGLTKDGQVESFTGNDCSMRKCPVGNPFSAVYSPYPSNQDDTSPNVQVSEVEITTKRILDTRSSNRSLEDSQITVKEIDGNTNLYYLTNFTNSLIKELGEYGGIIKCHYESDKRDRRRRRVLTMTKGDIIIADVKKWEEKNKIVNSYIQFDIKIHTDTESPTVLSESITIESVICDKIISNRTDWSVYNPAAVGLDGDNKKVVKWSNYGKILYDFGLFGNTTTTEGEGEEDKKYKYSKKVKMACTSAVEYDKVLKVYEDVDAEIISPSTTANYIPDDKSHVQFTITTDDKITNFICFLLGEKEVDILTTNLGVNVRLDDGSNKIGKYVTSGSIVNTNSHTVIALSDSDTIASNTITTSVTDVNKYLNINRTVYLSMINNNKIYELAVRITKIDTTTYTFESSLPLTSATFLPYIRLFPTDSANLQNQLLDETSHLYKLNIGLDFITSLQSPEVGGLLECTKDSANPMIIDVKGYKLDEENDQPIYSFVQFNEKIGEAELKPEVESRLLLDEFGMKGMSCKAIFGRNDLSFMNPIKPINNNTIIWSGYRPILQNMNFKINNKLSFACLKEDKNEFVIVNTNNNKYNGSDIKFTLDSLNDYNIDITKYICYLLSDSKGNNMNILDTDLGKNVRMSNNTYYLGKYTSNDLDIITNQEDDNTIIVFKYDEKNVIGKTDIKSNYKEIEDYLLVDRTIYLSMLLDNNIIIEKQVIISSNTGDADYTFTYKEEINELYNKKFLYYIRTYPICRLSSLPLPFIKGDALDDTTSKFWIVYNLITTIKVSSIPDVGGIIQCDGELEADIKGRVENETNAFYILFNQEVVKDNINTYKCDKYITKRNDLSLYYSFDVKKASGGGGIRILEDKSITVESDLQIYSKLLYNMGFFPSELVKIGEVEFYQITVNMSCINNNNNSILIYPNVLISTKSDLTEKVSLTFLNNYTALLTVAVNYKCNILSDSKGNLLDILDTDLGINIRKNGEGDKYVIGKYELPTEGIKTDIENGFLVIILPDKTIESDKITIPTEELDKNKKVELYLLKGRFIYIPITKDQVIREHTAKITSILPNKRLLSTNTVITIDPPVPNGWKALSTIRTNPTDEGIKENMENKETEEEVVEKEPLKVLDDSINLYIVNKNDSSTIYDLSIKLPKVGGILQCQYTSDDDDTIYKGSVDVKSYSTDNIYAEFKGVIYKENKERILTDTVYNIDNVVCDKILSTRNDLSLLNPQSAKDKKVTWIGYKVIFDSLYLPNNEYNISFACYTPKSLNQIKIYDSNINVKIEGNNYVFTFADDIQSPANDDICFLLSDINGKNITIEESDLFSNIRLGKNDDYYFGKYVSVSSNTFNIHYNEDDGSTVLTVGRDLSNESNIDISKLKYGYLNMSVLLISDSNTLLSLLTPGTRMSIYELYQNGRKVFIGSVQIMKILNDQDTIILDLSDKLLVKDFEKVTSPEPYGERVLPEAIQFPPDERSRILQTFVPSTDVIGYELIFDTAETTHIPIECSGQGECNRATGQCECYKGFEGSACQRLSCPNNCNGNGRCVALRELLSNEELKGYTGYGNSQTDKSAKVFPDLVFGCLCDSGTRGADCSLKECPSGIDPLDPNNGNVEVKKDCSGRGICNYESGKCECFDGFVGQACQIMSSII